MSADRERSYVVPSQTGEDGCCRRCAADIGVRHQPGCDADPMQIGVSTPEEDDERRGEALKRLGVHILRAERLMRADPSFADTLHERLHDLARRAEEDGYLVSNTDQADRLNTIAYELRQAAKALAEHLEGDDGGD